MDLDLVRFQSLFLESSSEIQATLGRFAHSGKHQDPDILGGQHLASAFNTLPVSTYLGSIFIGSCDMPTMISALVFAIPVGKDHDLIFITTSFEEFKRSNYQPKTTVPENKRGPPSEEVDFS